MKCGSRYISPATGQVFSCNREEGHSEGPCDLHRGFSSPLRDGRRERIDWTTTQQSYNINISFDTKAA